MYVTRFFEVNGKWNVKFIPEKPNGFAIYLLSGQNHSVEESSTIWLTHPEKKMCLEELLKRGYTVLTSELEPNHWGNEAACLHSEQLIHLLLKSEIMNKHIHFLAEGWGAVAAIKLLRRKKIHIRSMLFFNPCIYLDAYYEQEKQNRLYYKKMKHQLSEAYGVKPERINHQWIKQLVDPSFLNEWSPLLLIHRVDEKRYPLPVHSRKLERELLQKKQPVQLRLFSSTRSFDSIAQPAIDFYHKHERIL